MRRPRERLPPPEQNRNIWGITKLDKEPREPQGADPSQTLIQSTSRPPLQEYFYAGGVGLDTPAKEALRRRGLLC